MRDGEREKAMLMRAGKRSRWAAWIAVMGVFFLAGCVKENASPTTSQATSQKPLAEVTPSAKPNLKMPPSPTVNPVQRKDAFVKPTLPPARKGENTDAIRLSPRPSTAPSPSPQRQLASEAGLLAYYPQQRLMPEDFKIGPLQDGVSATRDYLKAVGTIRAFLDSIAKKEVDYTLVLPAVKAEIQAVISYPISQGYVPQRYRIGKIAFESDTEVRAALRLYKDEGVTTGEIYLKKSGDDWKVSDLQAGFTLLVKKYEKSKEPFTPGSYKFLLNDR